MLVQGKDALHFSCHTERKFNRFFDSLTYFLLSSKKRENEGFNKKMNTQIKSKLSDRQNASLVVNPYEKDKKHTLSASKCSHPEKKVIYV